MINQYTWNRPASWPLNVRQAAKIKIYTVRVENSPQWIYFLPFCLMKDYNTLITSLRLALPTVRRAKPPLGTVRVLIINLPRKGLTPRACMGDIGSGSWAPELTTFMLHVISASPFWTIFIVTFSIVLYNIVIPVINSITSINLKRLVWPAEIFF